VLLIAVVIAFIYKPYPFGREKAVATSADTGKPVKSEKILPVKKPAAEAEAEPNLLKFAQPTAEANPWAAELISEAMSYIEAQPTRIIDARDKLNETLPLPMSEQQRAFVKKQLSELAEKWLFSRTIFPQDRLCGSYKVKPGELFSTIGKQFKVPYEILMEINSISRPEALQAGDTIKVINGPFHARVYRSTFTMDLYLQNTFVRSFPVGLGKPGMETPTGLWVAKVDGKMIAPTWTDPITGKTYESEDPDYPLGSRWIGLEGLKGDAAGRTGFAIHGTKDPNEIGSSQGCIRLHNGDAILVYSLLEPGYSQVEVVE
jgi:LysM repeat protein